MSEQTVNAEGSLRLAQNQRHSSYLKLDSALVGITDLAGNPRFVNTLASKLIYATNGRLQLGQ